MSSGFRHILVSKKFHTASLKAIPSSYSQSTFLSIDTPANMYTDSTSGTRALLLLPTGTPGATYHAYINGFDFSEIPSNAYINKVTVSIKTMASNTSNLSANTYQACKGTTKIGTAGSNLTTQAVVETLDAGTWTRAELDTLSVIIEATRRNLNSYKNKNAFVYLYGIDVTVDYEYWA